MIDSDDDLLFEDHMNNDSDLLFELELDVPSTDLKSSSRPSSSSPSLKENKKSDKQHVTSNQVSSVADIPPAPPLPYTGNMSNRVAIPQKFRGVEGFFHTRAQSTSPVLIKNDKTLCSSKRSSLAQKISLVEKSRSKFFKPLKLSDSMAIPAVQSPQEDDVALTFSAAFGSPPEITSVQLPRIKRIVSGLYEYGLEVSSEHFPASNQSIPVEDDHVSENSLTPSSKYNSSFSSDYSSEGSEYDEIGSLEADVDVADSEWQEISLASPTGQPFCAPTQRSDNSPTSEERTPRLGSTPRFSLK